MSVGESTSDEAVNVAEPANDLLNIIINPASGNGRAAKRWPGIVDRLNEHGFRTEVELTTGPDDATFLARELARGGARNVVAIGGDGTVNEIINGLIEDDEPVSRDTRFLVVPCGTGKDLGRTLGTREVESAIAALKSETLVQMDLGRIQFRAPDGSTRIRYFANVADLGLGASVAQRINASSKALGGLLTYLLAAVRTIVDYGPNEITVDIGDDRIFNAPANMVVLANGQYFAGGMNVAPTASVCDGLLEMYILTDVGKRALLTSLLPRVYRGKHVGRNGVLHVKTSAATIHCPAGMLVEMDGEQIGTSPVRVDIVPRVLPVIVHPDTRRSWEGCADGGV